MMEKFSFNGATSCIPPFDSAAWQVRDQGEAAPLATSPAEGSGR